ncbi:MAG: hypothetical protein ACLRS1_03805 [Oscillospiraceae bacterium]
MKRSGIEVQHVERDAAGEPKMKRSGIEVQHVERDAVASRR